jgi:site-specific DNA-cytosine methylase
MSFADDFVLPEHQAMTSVARQIGNAVPPLLARAIADALGKALAAGRKDSGTPATVAA